MPACRSSAPAAGIAMGLIKEDERFAVLSDILGDEDHLGDMDFKVAGTERGVTSLQMDIKIAGITEEIMRVALDQAKDGRMHILGEMAQGARPQARAELGEHAPRIEVIKIPTDKIREVIGTGGKVIREIVEKTGAKIDIQDDGTVKVASADGESIKAAINWIKSIASEPEVGMIYEGTVVKVMDFGAFVNFFGAKDGLVHICQLAPRRVQKTTDVVKEGDKVKVKLLGFDERGKVRLSMKVVDQQTGEDLEAKQKAEGGEAREAAAGGAESFRDFRRSSNRRKAAQGRLLRFRRAQSAKGFARHRRCLAQARYPEVTWPQSLGHKSLGRAGVLARAARRLRRGGNRLCLRGSITLGVMGETVSEERQSQNHEREVGRPKSGVEDHDSRSLA